MHLGNSKQSLTEHTESTKKRAWSLRDLCENYLFFKLGLLTVCVLLLVSCETTSTSPRGSVAGVHPPPNEFRGAWIYDPRKFDPDEVVHNLKKAGFNAVFVRLSSAGAAYYPSNVLPTAPGTYQDFAQAYGTA